MVQPVNQPVKQQIHIRPAQGVWTVRASGAVIAESERALELSEGPYPPVIYFPREDAALALLERSTRQSACPHKGEASYYSIVTPSGLLPDAVWSYEAPKQPMGAIAGFLAFYPDKVTLTRR
jgi:uncharacterized protein (DUF427 family)